MPKIDLDAARNGAVCAWIRTVPNAERLATFLDSVDAAIRSNVEASAQAIFSEADGFLDEQAKKGDVDLNIFYLALNSRLLSRFPWANDATLGALRSYTGWYSWHEGYLTKP
jgi:hypothetical protein